MINKLKKIEENIKMLKCFEDFLKQNYNNIVILCVGNSEVWYDSFGPIVGTLLKDKYNVPCFVYGNIYNNIKASNLNNYIDWVKRIHFDKKFLVIDAALTNSNNYEIIFKPGSIKCAYYKNDSKTIGDFSVLSPVKNDSDNNNFNYKHIINNGIILSELIKFNMLKCKI